MNQDRSRGESEGVISTKSVTNALNASHRSTLNIAAQVITNHNAIKRLKEEYKRFRLQYFADSHDPFNDKHEKKGSSVAKIEQFVNEGLELKGLQFIDGSCSNNGNSNNNQNNNASNNSFNFGSSNNNNNNANNTASNSTFNWGSSNNSTANSSNNNNSGGGGNTTFNWGGSSNNNNNNNANNTASN